MSHRKAGLTHTLGYRDIVVQPDGRLRVGKVGGIPDITEPTLGDTTAWFLGPRAENGELLRDLIDESVSAIVAYRRSYLPGDPEVIDPRVKAGRAYQVGVKKVRKAHKELLDYLHRYATPFFSLRYQGHMLWDNTLPAVAGYVAAMLHNPNNVTIQASTATTPLAILVGWDLCRMVGYGDTPGIEPWSHITADGSIANAESLWACRETMFLPFGVRMALRSDERAYACLKPAADLTVTTCDGRNVRLLDADNWTLLNLGTDEVLALPARIAVRCGIDDVFTVWNLLIPFTLNTLGWEAGWREAGEGVGGLPVVTAPSTRHYSWPKSAALMGFGNRQMIDILVDVDARQDIDQLDGVLADCLARRIPVAMAVAVLGSTEESAVDDIEGVLALRERYRKLGLNFNIHVDAAWGGYQITALRNDYRFAGTPAAAERHPGDVPDPGAAVFAEDWSDIPISDHVCRQLVRVRECDGVTIDPHKWGYVQYPAGSILYRNGEARRLTTFTGAYIGGGAGSVQPGEPTVGIFGIEGSRPGAAATAVYMSHRVIRPTRGGHGRLVELCMFNTALFYANLVRLSRRQKLFTITPLARLPEIPGMTPEAVERFVADRLARMTIEEIRADPVAMRVTRALGPDQNILDYAFNFRDPQGRLNTDPDKANDLNALIYDAFHVGFDPPQPITKYKFLLTMTTFDGQQYGPAFMDSAARRMGLAATPASLNFLRSVIMDPYVADTVDGSYFQKILRIIKATVSTIVTHRMWAESEEKV